MAKAAVTPKALSRILNGELIEAPVVQIIAYKQVPTEDGGLKYRIIISDGEHMHQMCILTGNDINGRVDRGDFERYTIIRLLSYQCNDVKGNKVIVIYDAEVVSPGAVVAEKIGNPSTIQPNKSAQPPVSATPQPSLPVPSSVSNTSSASSPAGKRGRDENSRLTNNSMYSSPPPAKKSVALKLAICPINALNSFQRNWTVKGRVIAKSQQRTWNNAKGSGKLFSFDLKDATKEVRVTAFNQEVDKFYDMIQVGKVYIVSKATVKAAQRKYSNIDNEHELSLNSESGVDLGDEDDSSCPQVEYNFVTIRDMETVSPDSNVDVVGVITHVPETFDTITQKKTQKELEKLDVTITDKSAGEIRLTVWGNAARSFTGQVGDIILAQGTRVSDYQGRSLSGGSVYINPDHSAVDELRAWYSTNKDTLVTHSLTQASSGPGGRDNVFKLFFQLFEQANRTDKPVYGYVKVHVVKLTRVNDYPACPSENCKKRVLDLNNQFYRCEKCNKDYPDCFHRIILSGTVADATCSAYFSAFHDEALKMLEKENAQEVLAYKGENGEGYEELFTPLNFRTALMKVKVTYETYKEERRSRLHVVGLDSIDHGQYTKKLIAAIRAFQ